MKYVVVGVLFFWNWICVYRFWLLCLSEFILWCRPTGTFPNLKPNVCCLEKWKSHLKFLLL